MASGWSSPSTAAMPEIAGRQRATAHETLSRWLAGDHSSNNEFRPWG
jgi:hypothetical protein